jgi:hypothetical protein
MLDPVRRTANSLALICVMLAFATTEVFAVPPGEMLHDGDVHSFSGKCCMSFNESISVTEPAKPVAVVVTWHLEKLISQFGPTIAGLMVNGGPCTLYGSGFIPGSIGPGAREFQWILFPSDGLRAGVNTFTLCGGGVFDGSNFVMQEITLDARLSN